MNRWRKRLLALAVVICMCATMLPFEAFAEPAETVEPVQAADLAEESEAIAEPAEEPAEEPEPADEPELAEEPEPAAEPEAAEPAALEEDGETVSYYDPDTQGTKIATNVTVLEASMKELGSKDTESWYVARGEVTFESLITIKGKVNLILEDNCNMVANKGITVSLARYADTGDQKSQLIIWGQSSEDSPTLGKLNATGQYGAYGRVPFDYKNVGAGIGTTGGTDIDPTITFPGSAPYYWLVINGGDITATGGSDSTNQYEGAAGIGGGAKVGSYSNQGSKAAWIKIHGGRVKATGSGGAAGIGGGYCDHALALGGADNILIDGGTVTATGGTHNYSGTLLGGAGIGAGANRVVYSSGSSDAVNVSNIIIGGTAVVAATGGAGAAGIGSGSCPENPSVMQGTVRTITIQDSATVTATGGEGAAGIGLGRNGITAENFSITGGTVTAVAGDNIAPAISANPDFGDFEHATKGNIAENTESEDYVESTSNPSEAWDTYHWVKIEKGDYVLPSTPYYDPTAKAMKGATFFKEFPTDAEELSAGWYTVTGEVSAENAFTVVSGRANLILGEGASFSALNGITIAEGATLKIWGIHEDYTADGPFTISAINGAGAFEVNGGTGTVSGDVTVPSFTANGGKLEVTGTLGVEEGTVTVKGDKTAVSAQTILGSAVSVSGQDVNVKAEGSIGTDDTAITVDGKCTLEATNGAIGGNNSAITVSGGATVKAGEGNLGGEKSVITVSGGSTLEVSTGNLGGEGATITASEACTLKVADGDLGGASANITIDGGIVNVDKGTIGGDRSTVTLTGPIVVTCQNIGGKNGTINTDGDGLNITVTGKAGSDETYFTLKGSGTIKVTGTVGGTRSNVTMDGAIELTCGGLGGPTSGTTILNGTVTAKGTEGKPGIEGLTLKLGGTVTAIGDDGAPGIKADSNNATLTVNGTVTATGTGAAQNGVKAGSITVSDGATLEAKAGDNETPALSSDPKIGEYKHKTYGNTESNDETTTIVEWNDFPCESWNAYHWLKICPQDPSDSNAIYYSPVDKKIKASLITTDVTETTTENLAKWYIAKESVTVESLTLSDDMDLILTNGCELTVTGTINLGEHNLHIWGQNAAYTADGKLTVNGGIQGGSLTIYGGNITVNGTAGKSAMNLTELEIRGGVVTAKAGEGEVSGVNCPKIDLYEGIFEAAAGDNSHKALSSTPTLHDPYETNCKIFANETQNTKTNATATVDELDSKEFRWLRILPSGGTGAASVVSYYDPVGKQMHEDQIAATVTGDITVWNEGWYAVYNTVSISDSVTVNGNVNLVLIDGSKLDVLHSIAVNEGNSLTIWGQNENYEKDGELVAHIFKGSAAIGGGGSGMQNGPITINGGQIKALPSIDSKDSGAAAAIGGGTNGAGKNITINSGKVLALGYNGGAGIGGGSNQNNRPGACNGEDITINGGEVTAYGSDGAAAIGGGAAGNASYITITGGKVTAKIIGSFDGDLRQYCSYLIGHVYGGGAAIGAGYNNPISPSQVGGNADHITITGGTVNASSVDSYRWVGAGIGGGFDGIGSYITIGGNAHVTAIGGTSEEVATDYGPYVQTGGAGIGGGHKGRGNHITIKDNAKVTATGGYDSAGIGGSFGTAKARSGKPGNLYITIQDNAHVTAQGGQYGAGIGGGNGTVGWGAASDLDSNGCYYFYGNCVVEATGGEGGAGIGGGLNGSAYDIYFGRRYNVDNPQITAIGGEGGAGIGTGKILTLQGISSIGTHTFAYGGTITATGGGGNAAGVGTGQHDLELEEKDQVADIFHIVDATVIASAKDATGPAASALRIKPSFYRGTVDDIWGHVTYGNDKDNTEVKTPVEWAGGEISAKQWGTYHWVKIQAATISDMQLTPSPTAEPVQLIEDEAYTMTFAATLKFTLGADESYTLNIPTANWSVKATDPKETCAEGTTIEDGVLTIDPNETAKELTVTVEVDGEKKTCTIQILQPSLTVRFEAEGDESFPIDQTVTCFDPVVLPQQPVRAGFRLLGWTTEQDGETFWNFDDPVTNSMTLYAKWEEIVPKRVELNLSSLVLHPNKEETLTATITPSNVYNSTITWVSSNADIADVDETGKVTAKGVGSAVITATTANGLSTRCTVQVQHTFNKLVETVEPTCTALGYDVYQCAECDETVMRNMTKAQGHDFQPTEETYEPTCTEAGYTVYQCTRCEATENHENEAAKGHQEEVRGKLEATCTTTGFTGNTYCSVCEKLIKAGTATPALGHDFQPTEKTVEATCTEAGYTVYKCSRCEATENHEDEPAKGHQGEVRDAFAATCTTTGFTGNTYCVVCDELIKAGTATPALGHDFQATNQIVEPTCTEAGYTIFKCSRCIATEKHEGEPAKGHQSEVRDAFAATCTTTGFTGNTYCVVCNELIKAGTATPALGHDFQPTEETVEPTCTEAGYTVYKCSRCDATEKHEGEPAKGHQEEVRDASEPTCTEPGYTGNTYCSVCGVLLKAGKPIAALGHDWDEGVVTTEPSCLGAGIRTFTCRTCKETRVEAVSPNGHTPEQVDAVAPTCTEPGTTAGTRCTVCNAVIDGIDYVPALGHSPVVDPGKAPTCTEEGLSDGTHCGVCGEVLQEQTKLPATGHNYVTIVTKEATETSEGEMIYLCLDCGDSHSGTIAQKDCPSKPYYDVDTNRWYHEAVDYMISHKLMTGMSSSYFGVSDALTRAQFVTVLYRVMGEPDVSGLGNPFKDVEPGKWYTDAILWAADTGVVKGVSVDAYAPDEPVTREQLVTMLYRYACLTEGEQNGPEEITGFVDADRVSNYAKPAVAWAVANKLLLGEVEGSAVYINPKGTATRAEIAAVLMRWLER